MTVYHVLQNITELGHILLMFIPNFPERLKEEFPFLTLLDHVVLVARRESRYDLLCRHALEILNNQIAHAIVKHITLP
jgi:hypothetical protein